MAILQGADGFFTATEFVAKQTIPITNVSNHAYVCVFGLKWLYTHPLMCDGPHVNYGTSGKKQFTIVSSLGL
eukprot:scaffold201039_cov21-Prasinocladus_malaysianus.AAC.1